MCLSNMRASHSGCGMRASALRRRSISLSGVEEEYILLFKSGERGIKKKYQCDVVVHSPTYNSSRASAAALTPKAHGCARSYYNVASYQRPAHCDLLQRHGLTCRLAAND